MRGGRRSISGAGSHVADRRAEAEPPAAASAAAQRPPSRACSCASCTSRRPRARRSASWSRSASCAAEGGRRRASVTAAIAASRRSAANGRGREGMRRRYARIGLPKSGYRECALVAAAPPGAACGRAYRRRAHDLLPKGRRWLSIRAACASGRGQPRRSRQRFRPAPLAAPSTDVQGTRGRRRRDGADLPVDRVHPPACGHRPRSTRPPSTPTSACQTRRSAALAGGAQQPVQGLGRREVRHRDRAPARRDEDALHRGAFLPSGRLRIAKGRRRSSTPQATGSTAVASARTKRRSCRPPGRRSRDASTTRRSRC
jgi:hypothetical protein